MRAGSGEGSSRGADRGRRGEEREKNMTFSPSSVSTHLLRQKVHGRRPEDRSELQARDDVDEVDVVSRPGKGREETETGREGESRDRGRGREEGA